MDRALNGWVFAKSMWGMEKKPQTRIDRVCNPIITLLALGSVIMALLIFFVLLSSCLYYIIIN